jgi:hypothetical protein
MSKRKELAVKSVSGAYEAETRTESGKARTVGFEIEYAGVPLWRTAELVQDLFGGEIEEHSKAEWAVADTALGTFRLEIDAEPVKKLIAGIDHDGTEPADAFERFLKKTADAASDVVTTISEKIAPLEIVAPPVLVEEIAELDRLREALFYENAKDTQASFHHAFGLHINPEAVSLETGSILRHIQAFALLYPMLKELHGVDISRRLTPFIEPYSEAYLDHILADGYVPDQTTLIRDYHQFNRSRNKALDMLPLFAEMDESLVRALYGAEEKIHARPTYHYRLPNCELSRNDWSLMTEWKRWLHVEELASNPDRLDRLRRDRQAEPEAYSSRMREAVSAYRDPGLAQAGGAR